MAVSTLRYHAKTAKLYAATHGRSAWSIQFTPGVSAVPAMLTFTTKPGMNPAPQTLTVVNADHFGSTLQFTAAVAAAGTWASLTPATGSTIGSAGQPLSVSVAVGAMGIGEYDTSITVTGMGATPASVTVPVHLSVTMTGIAPDAGVGNDASVRPDGGTTTTGAGGATGAGGCDRRGWRRRHGRRLDGGPERRARAPGRQRAARRPAAPRPAVPRRPVTTRVAAAASPAMCPPRARSSV